MLRKDQPGFKQVPSHGTEHPIFTGATPVGIMSADNPRFPSAGDHNALKVHLASQGLRFEETEGRYGLPEKSMIIHGPTREQMFHLGKQFGQESVIHSQNGQHQMLYTNGDNEGKHHPSIGSYDYWHPGQELPEDYYTKIPNQGAFRLHFDFNKTLHQPMATVAPAPAPAAVTKHEIGHRLYTQLSKLVKAYEVAPGVPDSIPEVERPPVATDSFPWLPHPHAYDWHDGHTDHHFLKHAHGGVLLKHDQPPMPTDPLKHPHTDGAIPNQPKTVNDQAAGKGVATYHKFALPFGTIQPGKSDLFHYDYRGKQPQVDKLVADHGFQTYYAGGKFGKPDLANRNYNTKHLMVYDPTPQSGGDFGDQGYTDAWRKTHELSHALAYPELNSMYGEGRRIGKLGHHRSLKEALRAVHWEWLAAHKQRELNKQLGIHVPEETFNKELNTVMHDAAHRAVTGKFTEPSDEGFVPHSHKVPLETSLNMVREAARNLGLQGDHDLLNKTEEEHVSNKKDLSVPEALVYLREGLAKRIDDFAQSALELRKRETEALNKSVAKEEMAGPRDPGSGGGDVMGGIGGEDNMSMKEKNMKKNTLGPRGGVGLGGGGGGAPAPAPTPPAPPQQGKVGGMLPGELAKHDAMCMCEGCSKMEKYAKGEFKANKPAPGCCNAEGCTKKASGKYCAAHQPKDTKKSQPNTFVDDSKGEGKLPPKTGGKLVAGDSESGSDGTDTKPGKKIAKAGMPMGGMPKPPAAPKMAGAAIPPPHPGMKPMKLPGVAKPPAMGAGTPSPVAKAALEKAGPVTLGPRSMQARKNFGARTQQEQAIKLPGVRQSTGHLMDSMLSAPSKPQAAPTNTLPMNSPAPQLAGAGQPTAKPAQGVQTMAERVASRVPAGPSAFTAPPPQARPQLPGAVGKPTDPGVPALGVLAAAHTAKPKLPGVQTMVERVASNMPKVAPVANEPSAKKLIGQARGGMQKSEMIKNELGSCALCRKTEHAGRCQ